MTCIFWHSCLGKILCFQILITDAQTQHFPSYLHLDADLFNFPLRVACRCYLCWWFKTWWFKNIRLEALLIWINTQLWMKHWALADVLLVYACSVLPPSAWNIHWLSYLQPSLANSSAGRNLPPLSEGWETHVGWMILGVSGLRTFSSVQVLSWDNQIKYSTYCIGSTSVQFFQLTYNSEIP